MTHHAPAFEVTDRSATYDFLLDSVVAIALPRTVAKIKGNICTIFPTPFAFNAPTEGFPWNFVMAVGLQKKLE